MSKWTEVLVGPDQSIRETIRRIDGSSLQIALVVDTERKLLGTVTDGDVRRGILKGVSLDDSATKIMNAKPTVARQGDDRDSMLAAMRARLLHQIPVVDADNRVVGLEVLDSLLGAKRDNIVVLMAGGRGTRLRPLTDDTPKPLLHVGSKPILETIVESLIEQGFGRFYLAVNYLAEKFEQHFGDGSRWGVDIRYLRESTPLGTAGALSLLPEPPAKPLLVMNADLVTRIGFGHLVDFHVKQKAVATMGVREYDFQVPFGVVHMQNERIVEVQEKPTHRFFVNAGVYVFDPSALDVVPREQRFDMPDLFNALVKQGRHTAVFPIREYWLDVGRHDDFARATDELGAAK
jgi:dTDP-glucose pyrophosphorylase/predicted transcriptional regulator